ncbi:bile acid:sodium symporter family protein [Flavobacterium granuli]|uniref:Sodium/bile acid cotransporter 7 n=1 Tax=Flavobacterium granuli TaxID=280093 RepID=A0A1M5LRM1_9FLAO|nr:bile acid:sodium symporter family protein [Flavobacterium granuli]PRZ24076.1 sodium/bile acid cotransporter 7 [Flavobacterium granuli]SHG67645.1 solute carrier family 10 (sodium/bile acid cotransporter), member 7 [Flavobacterium granuli]
MKIKIDPFVLSILIVVLLAYLFPEFGGESGPLPLATIGSIGISLIFFFYGLKLSPEKMKSGLKNWKLHLLVQTCTFLVFPLLVLCFYPLIHTEDDRNIWLAFLFLASLPSTVSSSVVMVSIARGNIPSAIFNASISGLLGIIITPLWLGLFLNAAATNYDLGDIYGKLLLEVLAPVILGLLLHRYWGKFAQEYNRYLTLFDKTIILLIIYKSFCTSFEEKVFSSINGVDLFVIGTAILALFYLVYFLTGFFSHQLGFSTEDKITAQFCGTKKSLVHGTVFAKILFQGSASMGIILLPLMLFHSFQIFAISFIATRLARRKEDS